MKEKKNNESYRKELNESVGKDLPKRRNRKGIATDKKDNGVKNG